MVYVKLILTAVFWGGTFIAGKIIAQGVHATSAAFLRFAIASSCLLLIVYKKKGRLPALTGRQIPTILFLGLTGVFAYNLFFFSGLKHTEAGRASLIIANNPIVISLLSIVFFKESVTWNKGLGISLSVAGAVVVISNGQLTDLAGWSLGIGEFLIFGCVVSWAAYSVLGKVILQGLSPLVSVAYSSLAGAVLLLVPAAYNGVFGQIGNYTPVQWCSLVYLGVFGTVFGFYWYYQGIDRIGPMKSGVFINFVPIFATVFSFFILDEPLSGALVIGGAMVIAGVYLTNVLP